MNELPVNPIQQAGFQMLLEAIPDATVIVNPAGAIVLVNAQTEQLFGYTRAALQGQPIEALLPTRFRGAHVRQRLGYAAAPHTRTSGATLNLWGLCQDGREFPIDVHLRPLPTSAGTFVVATLQDLSERKHIEAALRQSEERWRTYVEQATDLIIILDSAGLITSVNRAVCDALGYAAEELLGKRPSEWIVPAERETAAMMLSRLMTGEGVKQLELTVIARDGRQLWLEVRGRTLYENGQLVGTLHIARNITERKQAEVQLRETQEFLSQLLDHAPVAIYTHSLDGTLRTVNRAWENFMQRTREVTIGTSLVGMLDDEAAERFNQTTQHIVTTKIPIEYDTAFRMNGELRQFHILRFPLLNATGHVESIGGIGLDVTEQRRAAATLRESEERYRSLFENSAVGIFQSTPSGQYNLVNPAYAQMLGYTIEELLTLDIAERLYWDSAEREQLRAQYEPLDVMEGVEMRWKKKNGEQIIVNVHAKTVRDAQGQVVRYEGLVLDVTERKRIETQLRESEERLRAERSLLRTVIDHLPAIIFVKNLEKQFAISNAAHVRWLGLTHEADVIGKTVHDFYPATQAQLFQETDQQVLETRQGQLEREYAVRNPAGQLHWHVTTKLPLTDSTHNIIGLVTISHDITDRKQAEEALRASEEKFNKAFQASPVSMIFARSSDGQWLEVNDTLVTLSGYTRKEMLGQNAAVALRMWGNPEDRSRYRELFAAQGFVHDFEIPFRKKSGEVGVGLLSAERIELAGESYGLISLQDITERKHAETALQESDQRYRGAIIAAGLVPYVIDYRPPRFTFMGEGILKLTGYSAEEYTPTLLKESVQEDYVWGTNAQLTPSEARQRFRSGQLLEWRSDMRIQTRSGESRWLSDASIPLLDEFGKAKGAIGILQDITERKHAEEKLQASLREKETLLKEVHHRVKNNMQVISSLLNLQAGQIADPQTRDVFRDSQNRVRAMALVHEKLYQSADLARIQFGEYIRHLTDFLFRAYSQQAQNISLQLDIADVTLGVDTAIPCGLLINELVSNALKHAFPQGRAGTLTVALHATSPQQCSLVVQDDGVGMPTAFDWQQTTSLGLQLVLSLVSQLAGEVQLTNQAGTTFTIQFAVSSVGA